MISVCESFPKSLSSLSEDFHLKRMAVWVFPYNVSPSAGVVSLESVGGVLTMMENGYSRVLPTLSSRIRRLGWELSLACAGSV